MTFSFHPYSVYAANPDDTIVKHANPTFEGTGENTWTRIKGAAIGSVVESVFMIPGASAAGFNISKTINTKGSYIAVNSQSDVYSPYGQEWQSVLLTKNERQQIQLFKNVLASVNANNGNQTDPAPYSLTSTNCLHWVVYISGTSGITVPIPESWNTGVGNFAETK